ncbi:MAG: ATP-grasp domain-containing protein, partial [Gammaproteobacteria bacterium]
HNESTLNQPLIEQAEKLLKALQWNGPAMVEFRHDERDGRYRLMEINARFWGTLELAIKSGVDFPWLACLVATGTPFEGPQNYRAGSEQQWSLAELHNFKEH